MKLFEDILQELNILEEAPRKKISRKRRNNKKPKKVLKVNGKNKSNNQNTFQGGIYTQSTLSDKINNAISNMKPAIINYNSGGENLATGERTIYPIAYGLSKANNPVVRAFEPKGDTVRGVPAWKFFRVDRILSWNNVDNERFNPQTLQGVNKSGDMLMTKVYNISPFGGGIHVNRSNEFITIGPDAIKKQDIEQPEINKDDNKTYSTDNIINDILRNMEKNHDKSVDNTYANMYTNNNNTQVDTINAPETKPITKQELGDEQQVDDTTSNDGNASTPNETKPVYKDEIENGNDSEENKPQNDNKFVNFFKNLTNRMNNLYK